MTKPKERYFIHPDISWRTFKKIWDKFPDTGPVAKHLDKIVWELLKERRLNVEVEEVDLFLTNKPLPKKFSWIKDTLPVKKK